MEVGENPELLAEEVEGNGKESTQRETPQEAIVDGTRTEHFSRTESTPEDRSGEKRVGVGTSEVILLRGQADVGDLGHLVVEYGRGDESGDESCPHLAAKGDPRGDVHVVCELEILSEGESLRGRDESVNPEVDYSSGVTGEPETTEDLGNNAQGNLGVRDGQHDTTRDAEDHSEENCKALRAA